MYLSTPLGLTVAVARGFTHQRFQSDDGKMVDRKGKAKRRDRPQVGPEGERSARVNRTLRSLAASETRL